MIQFYAAVVAVAAALLTLNLDYAPLSLCIQFGPRMKTNIRNECVEVVSIHYTYIHIYGGKMRFCVCNSSINWMNDSIDELDFHGTCNQANGMLHVGCITVSTPLGEHSRR